MTADPARLPLGNTSIRLHREETHAGRTQKLRLEFKVELNIPWISTNHEGL